MDHIHVVNEVIAKSAEYTKPFYTAFIGYEEMFDSVLTAAVFKRPGNRGTYIRLLEDIYIYIYIQLITVTE